MNLYEEKWKIRITEVDLYRRLKLSSLFARLQETSVTHTEMLGIHREQTLNQGLLWVVAQQSARIIRIPRYDETVLLRTWPGKTMHLFFPRYWQLLDLQGSILLDARAFWALMNQSTRRIAFPEKYGIHIEGTDDRASTALPKRLKAEQVPEKAFFTVPFSYLDLNGHMNNTRYFDLAADFLPEEYLNKDVCGISTEYIGEAKYKDTLTLRYGLLSEDNGFYLSGENGKQPVFRMKLQFKNCVTTGDTAGLLDEAAN